MGIRVNKHKGVGGVLHYLTATMGNVLTVETYSHGVRLSGYDRDMFNRLSHFVERLALKEPRKLPHGGMVMELRKKYYGMTEDKREVFIHRNTLPELLAYLADKGVDITRINRIEIPVPVAAKATYDVMDHYTPRDYQEVIIDTCAASMYSTRVDLQTGKGKGQILSAKIRIPGGWSTMGEMKVGTKVIAADGTVTEVTGVFPQGLKRVFKVTFADGRSTEVDDTHLWKVYYINTVPHKRWRVVNTVEMLRLISMPNPRVYVQLIEPEVQPEKNLPIPPYTLGVILGDGGLTGTSLIVSKNDEELFTNLDEELPAALRIVDRDGTSRAIVSTGMVGANPYLNALREMGLWSVSSPGKFIPEGYFEGSRGQRLALLQGLMDTDGTVNTVQSGGSISFSSSSYRLATGVQYLVRSLGGIASISVRETHYTYNGEKNKGQTSYNVNIRYPRPSELFRITRKKERTNDEGQYCADLKLRVKSVEFVGNKETQCISVAHEDRLYVTDDFIVTHNTFCALSAASKKAVRTVIMLPPKYFGIWQKALKETYNNIEGRFVTVSGSAELQMVIDRALDNDLEWDVLLISSVTYRAYIEAYERLGENIKSVGYNVPPPRFHEALQIGLQINDEIQEDPGLVFRTDIFTNVAKQIYLSATPYTGNAFVTKMIDEMLPPETSCELPSYDVYIDAVRLLYSDPTVQSKDYLTPYKNTYNHARYETQMLKNKRRTDAYFNMVKRIVKGVYVNDRLPGQKMLILCATVQFIEKLTRFLQTEFPELVVGQHVSGSDFRKLQTNDLTVSTIKSAGTGQDIIDLREVLLLQATDSKKDNIQILGRLRKLKNFEGVTPRLTYMACQNIAHHVRYARNKEEHFTGKVNSHRTMRL
jgi:hypothetical protein